VASNTPPPVFAVLLIRLATVHYGVPITPFGRGDSLTNTMTFVEKIVKQPQAGQATLRSVLV